MENRLAAATDAPDAVLAEPAPPPVASLACIQYWATLNSQHVARFAICAYLTRDAGLFPGMVAFAYAVVVDLATICLSACVFGVADTSVVATKAKPLQAYAVDALCSGLFVSMILCGATFGMVTVCVALVPSAVYGILTYHHETSLRRDLALREMLQQRYDQLVVQRV